MNTHLALLDLKGKRIHLRQKTTVDLVQTNLRFSIVKNDGAGHEPNYFGGKNGSGTYQFLINQIPPHEVYIEPFLGSGSILRNKAAATASYGVELSLETFNKWFGFSSPSTTIINGDGISFLQQYDWKGGEFVYCDPPYVLSTRTSNERYDYDFTDEDHIRLLSTLLAVSDLGVNIMISGYWSELYVQYLQNWRYCSFNSMTRGGVRKESLWMNYDTPTELHDYSYLGKDYREHERIRKKIKRKVRQLEELPPLERMAILEALKRSF